MKLYTRTGDQGETGLYGGRRVEKRDPRICALGDVDELNAALGWVLVAEAHELTRQRLLQIQDRLFVMGARLASFDSERPTDPIVTSDVTDIEGWIDEATSEVPPLTHFILPGGSETASRYHLARAVCRRAERGVLALSFGAADDRAMVVYLNRLSDYLFALGRLANHRAGVSDTIWNPS